MSALTVRRVALVGAVLVGLFSALSSQAAALPTGTTSAMTPSASFEAVASDWTPTSGEQVSLTGLTDLALAGAPVAAQVQVTRHQWRTEGTGVVGASGMASATFAARIGVGVYRLLVGRAGATVAVSRTVTLDTAPLVDTAGASVILSGRLLTDVPRLVEYGSDVHTQTDRQGRFSLSVTPYPWQTGVSLYAPSAIWAGREWPSIQFDSGPLVDAQGGSSSLRAVTSTLAAEIGTPYRLQLVTRSGALATWKSAETWPAGLSLSPQGVVSGTPQQQGSFVVDVTTSDGASTVTQRLRILVDPPLPAVTGSTQQLDRVSASGAWVSDDGRYVLYRALLSRRLLGDTADYQPSGALMRWDRQTDARTPVQFTSDGAPCDCDTLGMSPDGALVALTYLDSSGVGHLALRDVTAARTTDLASGRSLKGALSPDGTAMLVDDASGLSVVDLSTRTGTPVTGVVNRDATMTANDGAIVVFAAPDGVLPDDTNGVEDVFAWDRATGTIRCLTRAANGAQADGGTGLSSLSDDGRLVTMVTSATNFAPKTALPGEKVVQVDLASGRRTVVSRPLNPTDHPYVDQVVVSRDGSGIAFDTGASTTTGSGRRVWDRRTGQLVRLPSPPALSGDYSFSPYLQSVSRGGRYVFTQSYGRSSIDERVTWRYDVVGSVWQRVSGQESVGGAPAVADVVATTPDGSVAVLSTRIDDVGEATFESVWQGPT